MAKLLFWVLQTFSRSFICIMTVKKHTAVMIFSFSWLGPRPMNTFNLTICKCKKNGTYMRYVWTTRKGNDAGPWWAASSKARLDLDIPPIPSSHPGLTLSFHNATRECQISFYSDLDFSFECLSKTSPQAKHHKLSLLFTSLTTLTSLTFTLFNFHH